MTGWPEPTELDRMLGDPRDPDNPCGFVAMVARDAHERRPAALAAAAGPALGLSFVPTEHGGDLSSMDTTLLLARVAARRDATIMHATMVSITAVSCVLLAGSAAQRDRVVELLRRGESIGFAFAERETGDEVLANSCLAEPTPDGFVLRGDKWMVGDGGRAGALLLVARTGGRGPAAFSTLLLDSDVVERACGGMRRLGGMRGIGFADFHFAELRVPANTMVGARGRGLETALRAMQVVRVMSTACSLGCADTGLRLAMDFLRTRQAGEQARRELATAAALLFAADAVALAAARAMHVLPGVQSLWSAVVKHVVVDTTEEILSRCANVLGNLAMVRDGPYAAFDVLRRDNATVRFVDTSPAATERLIAAELPRLTPHRTGPVDDRLAVVFGVDNPLPPLDFTALTLAGRGGDPLLDAVPVLAANVPATSRARVLADALAAALRAPVDDPADAPHRLAFLHAAASCLALWHYTPRLPLGPDRLTWLTAVLEVLLARARRRVAALPTDQVDAVLRVADQLHRGERLYSVTALPLCKGDDSDACA
ncbi:acyl-CoA dehydrogenase family protein [Kutzneria sp. CA-103260]|uniref:acyl-CoA dehydrogenase family protein n=1 Tax=Kutzneria sp. CA-103260 TaxID=2802641 RepID=UPI001BA8AAE7|nr:acyl-CoA dehydrogenase family protein [Kutzneria sp. CA-103260]QUQ72493.1 non-ribosomal peptide synthetase/acyl-CoA dehydrogenase fusion protein [Kutzneria sp. CA-103260]